MHMSECMLHVVLYVVQAIIAHLVHYKADGCLAPSDKLSDWNFKLYRSSGEHLGLLLGTRGSSLCVGSSCWLIDSS